MVKASAGLLMYRINTHSIEYFIGHPGGPFYKHKDVGVWSLPKGELEENEDSLHAAQREFKEETGITSQGPFTSLGHVILKSGKRVDAWAFQGDWNGLLSTSSYVRLEWPTGSGKIITFPEVDKVGFFTAEQAKEKLHPAQTVFIDRLQEELRVKP